MAAPPDFLCPLTKNLLLDPVTTVQGINYERSAITQWLEDGNKICPVTGCPLRVDSLRSNPSLQWKTRYWQSKQEAREETEAVKGTDHSKIVVPIQFQCNLSKKLMTDPVMTKYGHSYERSAISNWIALRGQICPMTGRPLKLSQMISNASLQRQIQSWLQSTNSTSTVNVVSDDSLRIQPTIQEQTVTEEMDGEHLREATVSSNRESCGPTRTVFSKTIPISLLTSQKVTYKRIPSIIRNKFNENASGEDEDSAVALVDKALGAIVHC